MSFTDINIISRQ